MLPINKFVPIAAVILLAYMAGLYRFLTHFDKNRCGMTYMFGYPQFIDVPVPLSSEPHFENYRLYLYAEGRFVEKVRHLRLTGIPVLFIPGNGGSYRQVRSLASINLHKGLDLKAPFHFNFFSIDLNEEYSALFGGVLNAQTKFAQESIRTISSLYPSYRRPVSIILVGHSMGGVIAKGLMLDDNFDSSAVKVVLTLASPHVPILLFDEYLAAYYKNIDLHWQKQAKNVTLISVGGGNRDLHVRSAFTFESSADVNVLVPSIPGVWKSTDHLCILWCKDLIKVINRAFFDVIDTSTMQIHDSDIVRSDVFKYHFQHRSNGKHYFNDLHMPSMKFDTPAKWLEITEPRFHYFKDDGMSKTTYIMIPTANLSQNFQYDALTIDVENVKDADWVFACRSDENRNGKYCVFGENLSKHGNIMPTLTQKRKQIKINAADIFTDYFTHIVVKISPVNDPVSVSVDFHKSDERTIIAQLPNFFHFGQIVIPSTEPGALTYTVQISNLENEIQAGYLYLRPIKCEKSKHYAVLQTKIPWSQESTHTFSSHKKQAPLFLKIYRPKPVGETAMATALLTLDPECIYTVSIGSSFIDYLAAVAQTHSPLLIPNIIGILLLTLSAQLMHLRDEGECSMFHSVLLVGAQPVQTLCITNIATHILSVLGVIPATHYQLNLWMSIFFYTTSFAILYFVGFGLWYSLIFSTNKVSDIVLSFLTRYFGSLTWSEWILSGLEQLPIIISGILVALVYSTCGGLALWLGAVFYYLKLCSLYEDFLNYYIYYPFRYIKNQLKLRLSWKSNAEINDMWRQTMPPSVDDDANDLTPLHFHFTLFLLWTALSILNVPSTLMWAHNYQYKVQLQPDPSWFSGLALSLSAAFIWPGSCPNSEINYYREISYLTYTLGCVCIIFCQHTVFYLQYIGVSVFVLISAHQVIGRYLSKRPSAAQESEQLALPEDEHLALEGSDDTGVIDDAQIDIAVSLTPQSSSESERGEQRVSDLRAIPLTFSKPADAKKEIETENLDESDSTKVLVDQSDPAEVMHKPDFGKQVFEEINDEIDSKPPVVTPLDAEVDNCDIQAQRNDKSSMETSDKNKSICSMDEPNSEEIGEFVTSEENDFVKVFRKIADGSEGLSNSDKSGAHKSEELSS